MSLAFNSYFAGGPTKFSLFHIWKAYQVIDSQGPIGRKALADALQIGEGSIRTILDKMVREGSVENTRMGTVITDRGREAGNIRGGGGVGGHVRPHPRQT